MKRLLSLAIFTLILLWATTKPPVVVIRDLDALRGPNVRLDSR